MKILYFARLRQVIGRGQDELVPPPSVATVAQLIEHLKAQDEALASAFADLRALRVAVNQKHASFETPLAGAREVAFFPPVTGG